MRQQEHQQQLNEMDNNDRKRDETTSLDASTVQHKAPVKGRINNDPLVTQLPHNDINLKVQTLKFFFWIFKSTSLTAVICVPVLKKNNNRSLSSRLTSDDVNTI